MHLAIPVNNDDAVDMALDVALVIVRNGGSTELADRAFHNVLKGCKKEGLSTIWRLDYVAATGTAEGRRVTVLRRVGGIRVDLARTSAAAVLAQRVANGEIETAALASEVERVKTAAPVRNGWLMMLVAAFTAAAFSQLCGGDWGGLGIASVAAGFGQFLRLRLQAMKLTVAPVTFFCGLTSASIACVGLRLGLSQTPPAATIASVVYLVPGLLLINGFVDIVSHEHLIMGLQRMTGAAYLFLVLAIDIAFAYTVIY